jgi:HAMP domain-containing protein
MGKKDTTVKSHKKHRYTYFAARELQLTIAVLAVIALLGGILLQSLSSVFIQRYGEATPILGLILIAGYIAIVVLLAVFFTHRLVGPFKRLEYEMKMISSGDISKRLSIRTKDDLHIRNFVGYANEFIASFEALGKEYNSMNSAVIGKLIEITETLSKEGFDSEEVKGELQALQKKIKKFMERW